MSTCVNKWKALLDLLYYWLLQVKTEGVIYLTLQGRIREDTVSAIANILSLSRSLDVKQE